MVKKKAPPMFANSSKRENSLQGNIDCISSIANPKNEARNIDKSIDLVNVVLNRKTLKKRIAVIP